MTPEPPPGYEGPSLSALAGLARERIGAYSEGAGGEDVGELSVLTPHTGESIGSVPACGPAEIEAAAERARDAQSAWAERPIGERVAVVERFANLVRASRSELLDVVQLESGKTRMDAMEECMDVELVASYYADRAPGLLASEKRTGAVPLLTRAREHHDPYGVAGFIVPWNYPLTLAVSDAVPALLAGNAVLIKPAEQTPFIALYAAELLHEAGVPEDCFQVLPGEGNVAGPALVEASDVLSFTGSTAVGREVAAQAGRELTPATLELGGAGPMLVREDAPLGRTVTGAVQGGFASAGQLCIAVERIYVHEDRADAFLDRLLGRVRDLELGASFDYGPDVGSLVSAEQADRVAETVEDAVEAGATLLTGGRRRPDVGPFAYEPTVLTDVPPDTAVACEETFGPVVTVTPVADDAEAIRRANDTQYGLHASVWTGDTGAGKAVARQLDCGTVSINDAYIAMWGSTDAPMGGRNDSGIGRRHGAQGLRKFTQSQSVTVQRGYPLTGAPGVPDRITAAALSAYLRIVRGLGLR